MTREAETMKLMQELTKYCSLEEIAVELEKHWHTIWSWYKGKRTPSKGDYELMRTLLKRRQSEQK